MKKIKLLLLLASLDDEAFAYIALALMPGAMSKGANIQIWPDGLGGFRGKELMKEIRTAAEEYIKDDAVRQIKGEKDANK